MASDCKLNAIRTMKSNKNTIFSVSFEGKPNASSKMKDATTATAAQDQWIIQLTLAQLWGRVEQAKAVNEYTFFFFCFRFGFGLLCTRLKYSSQHSTQNAITRTQQILDLQFPCTYMCVCNCWCYLKFPLNALGNFSSQFRAFPIFVCCCILKFELNAFCHQIHVWLFFVINWSSLLLENWIKGRHNSSYRSNGYHQLWNKLFQSELFSIYSKG